MVVGFGGSLCVSSWCLRVRYFFWDLMVCRRMGTTSGIIPGICGTMLLVGVLEESVVVVAVVVLRGLFLLFAVAIVWFLLLEMKDDMLNSFN